MYFEEENDREVKTLIFCLYYFQQSEYPDYFQNEKQESPEIEKKKEYLRKIGQSIVSIKRNIIDLKILINEYDTVVLESLIK